MGWLTGRPEWLRACSRRGRLGRRANDVVADLVFPMCRGVAKQLLELAKRFGDPTTAYTSTTT